MEERKTITSATAFLAISKPEDESLDAQIERLSKYIETMVSPPPRPSLTVDESMLFSTMRTSIRTSSVDWDERRSGIYDEPSILQERSIMCIEDLRSLEMRRSDKPGIEEISEALAQALGTQLPRSNTEDFVEAVQNLMTHQLNCSLYELYNIQSQLERIISFAEEDLCHEGQVNLGSHSFNIKVKSKNSAYFKEKQWLFDLIEGRVHKKDKEYDKNYYKALENTNKRLLKQVLVPNSIEEYGKILQSTMDNSFKDFYTNSIYGIEFQYMKSPSEIPQRSAASLQMEIRQLQQTKEDHERLRENFAWESAELSMLKSSYFSKEQELSMKYEFLEKNRSLFKRRLIEFEKEKLAFEEAEEDFELRKRDFEDIQEENRDRISQVKSEILELMSSDSKPTTVQKLPSRPGTPTSEDPQIRDLREEISELETELRTAEHSRKDSIALKLTRCQTQLSNLRSKQAIASSLKASTSVKSVLKKVDGMGHKLNRSFCNTPKTDRSFEYPKKTDRSFEYSKKRGRLPSASDIDADKLVISPQLPPPSPASAKKERVRHVPVIKIDKSEVQKEIDRIKIRLRAREDEIEAKEKTAKKMWMQMPSADKVIPLFEKEKERLEGMKRELDKQYDEVDKQFLTIAQRNAHLKKLENDVKSKQDLLDQEVNDIYFRKLLVENKLTSLIECFY